MKINTSTILLQFFLGLIFVLGFTKSDPDPLQDYCIASTGSSKNGVFYNGVPCINPEAAMASHFATSALSKPGDTSGNQSGFNVSLTSINNLRGLNTLGLAMARVDIAPDGLVPLHSHPRASELAILLKGSLRVGFVNTSNHLFTAELKPGDCFVFPKGLIHYVYNMDIDNTAVVIAGFNSQNPGVQMVSMATSATTPELPAQVLKRTFWTSGRMVDEIRKNILGG